MVNFDNSMTKQLELDVKDKKLIFALEQDARASLSRIAKKIGTSKEVANYRYKRLMANGFIKRFIVLIDNVALDLKLYRLVLDLHNLKKGIRDEMINELRGIKNVDLNVFLQSNRDLEISLYIKNPWEFYTFYDNFFGKYSQYIRSKNLSVVTKQHYFSHRYLHGYHNTVVLGESKQIVKLGKNDEKIIHALMENPRMPIIDIAKQVGLSSSAVLHRVKSLIAKKVIKGFGVIFDKSMLGYNSYRVEIILKDLSKKKIIITNLSRKKMVTKINEFVGEMDLDFEVDFKTTLALDDFLKELRFEYPDIRDFRVMAIVKD